MTTCIRWDAQALQCLQQVQNLECGCPVSDPDQAVVWRNRYRGKVCDWRCSPRAGQGRSAAKSARAWEAHLRGGSDSTVCRVGVATGKEREQAASSALCCCTNPTLAKARSQAVRCCRQATHIAFYLRAPPNSKGQRRVAWPLAVRMAPWSLLGAARGPHPPQAAAERLALTRPCLPLLALRAAQQAQQHPY